MSRPCPSDGALRSRPRPGAELKRVDRSAGSDDRRVVCRIAAHCTLCLPLPRSVVAAAHRKASHTFANRRWAAGGVHHDAAGARIETRRRLTDRVWGRAHVSWLDRDYRGVTSQDGSAQVSPIRGCGRGSVRLDANAPPASPVANHRAARVTPLRQDDLRPAVHRDPRVDRLRPRVGAGRAPPRQPRAGEGFVIDQILRAVRPTGAWFWGAHGRGELDLLDLEKGRRIGFEMKFNEAPDVTRLMRDTVRLLALDHLFVVSPARDAYPVDTRISVLPAY